MPIFLTVRKVGCVTIEQITKYMFCQKQALLFSMEGSLHVSKSVLKDVIIFDQRLNSMLLDSDTSMTIKNFLMRQLTATNVIHFDRQLRKF